MAGASVAQCNKVGATYIPDEIDGRYSDPIAYLDRFVHYRAVQLLGQ
jgi:hypothetical protein